MLHGTRACRPASYRRSQRKSRRPNNWPDFFVDPDFTRRGNVAPSKILRLSSKEEFMAKGYWVTFYRTVSNPAALSEYAKLAGPPIQAAGGRFLSRGTAAKAYEEGVKERSVLIEFDSLDKAVAAYESAAYQAALKVLQGAVERDVRILEGV